MWPALAVLHYHFFSLQHKCHAWMEYHTVFFSVTSGSVACFLACAFTSYSSYYCTLPNQRASDSPIAAGIPSRALLLLLHWHCTAGYGDGGGGGAAEAMDEAHVPALASSGHCRYPTVVASAILLLLVFYYSRHGFGCSATNLLVVVI